MFSRARLLGWDGWWTLLLSGLVTLGSLGLTYIWALTYVVRCARRTDPFGEGVEIALVLGRQLKNNQVTALFAQRLERARDLIQNGQVKKLMVLGGTTGSNSISEAAAGCAYLVAGDVVRESIILEDRSRHTLENLRHARQEMASNPRPAVLITNRYHLARSLLLAAGLGLNVQPCPAEPAFPRGVGPLILMAREAVFVHWYHVGRIWSEWTGNHESLARIR